MSHSEFSVCISVDRYQQGSKFNICVKSNKLKKTSQYTLLSTASLSKLLSTLSAGVLLVFKDMFLSSTSIWLSFSIFLMLRNVTWYTEVYYT